jgi:hypothetical protein
VNVYVLQLPLRLCLARGYFIVCTLCNAVTSFYGLTIDNAWLED